ncbi:MAG: SOS response-associated peptidase [Aliishimia sp.]
MCGRFAVTLPSDAMALLFAAQPANDLPDTPNFNVCPTNSIAVVTADETGRRLQPMRWGFLPHWYKAPNAGPLLINARSETLAEKPAFKAACRARRCLISCTGFYEWTKDPDGNRLPWYIRRADDAPVVFAGVWQDWMSSETGEQFRTCAIVTCGANKAISLIHHRMPVLLEAKDHPLWLGEEGKGAAVLMKTAADDVLEWHRVGPAINSNRAKGAALIEPLHA